MYNDNLMIVGYDSGYGYNSYYVDKKNKSVAWPSNRQIAESIDIMMNDGNNSEYEVDNVVVKTNKVVNKRVVTTYYQLKLVKLYKNFKCKKSNGSTTYLKPRIFYPQCNKVNVLCSSLRGAYLSSLSLCNQNLY